MMPFAPLWCVLFFLMMCTLGFGSEVSDKFFSKLLFTPFRHRVQFSIMETVMTSMIDEFKTYLNTPKKIILFRFGLSFVFFLLGLSMVTRVGLRSLAQGGFSIALSGIVQGGLYVLNIVDQYLGGFPWLVIGVVELVTIAWIYGRTRERVGEADVETLVFRC